MVVLGILIKRKSWQLHVTLCNIFENIYWSVSSKCGNYWLDNPISFDFIHLSL